MCLISICAFKNSHAYIQPIARNGKEITFDYYLSTLALTGGKSVLNIF
jgi:hypothetical protein